MLADVDNSCKPNESNESKATNIDEKPKEPQSPTYDLTKFKLKKILNNNAVRKSISMLGSFPDICKDKSAIVIFEKHAYRESDVATNTDAKAAEEPKPSYFSSELQVRADFVNNIYGSYHIVPSSELCGVKGTVIYPATEKHIEKYSICQKYIINETVELYESVTLPYIRSSQFSLDWVYNILEHKQETERIVYEDNDPETGFILLPDLKWDGRNMETLYLLGIIHKHNVKSLRDLNASHLPLLRNLRARSLEAIQKRYGYHSTQLRMYFHYQPSFYHLHVHINPVRNDAPGIWCEKAHMLDTVINNLELMGDYYQRATLPFVLYEGNKLLDLYEEKMPVRKPKTATENTPTKVISSEESDDSVVETGFSDDEIKQPPCKLIKLATNEGEAKTI